MLDLTELDIKNILLLIGRVDIKGVDALGVSLLQQKLQAGLGDPPVEQLPGMKEEDADG